MSRKCMLTGARPNVAHQVSHSNIKTKKRQLPNIHTKRIFWAEGNAFVSLRISTRALRTLRFKTLGQFLREEGLIAE